jgi:hypothetical protein
MTKKNPQQKPRRRPGAGAPNFNGAPLVPGNPGNAGGKKGRSGRRPLLYKQWCSQLLHNEAVRKQVLGVLKDAKHPQFVSLLRLMAEYGSELPPVDVTLRLHEESDAARLKLLERLIGIRERRKATKAR